MYFCRTTKLVRILLVIIRGLVTSLLTSFASWIQSAISGAINIGLKGLSPGGAVPVTHFREINVVLEMVSYSIHGKDLTAPAAVYSYHLLFIACLSESTRL
ncbi:hypothetical protein BKA70DRAFT_1238691 [Coprinopsis sp. MPI-PUGE-AT-0042]|nr:hypothetical protein BKA70DRAFT_1238691 [Coprinopsis sp. MPI-PUGE-AT-0042]